MTVAEVEQVNPFAVGKALSQSKGMMEVAASRQAQEVQAAMVIAKKFPRDPFEAFNKIMNACKRLDLAKESTYVYSRGGANIKGPSIRLAEVLAQQWGNIDFGIIELEQRFQESTVMSYAWDLETNTRQTKVFTVPHRRDTKSGGYFVKDARDIYEIVANNGARRLRACILGVIPGDVVDAAVRECEKTLIGDNSEGTLEDRIRKMVAKFSEIGVSTDMLEMKLGHKLDTTTVQEVVNLGGIYKSISDNMAPIEQYFDRPNVDGQPQTLKEKMASKMKNSKEKVAEKRPDVEEKTDSSPTTETSEQPAATPPTEDFSRALAALSAAYDGREDEIDGMLKNAGTSIPLQDILEDCADESARKAVIRVAQAL